ncbi:MAG: hypothetical protein BWX92_01843 [Deltaproteobacteria bacterium ADurb.Bin135]|nr:MAG: hypothetical protein BWX92_01843 [Deltaproteobacteria bacterium ADurb.Bin135]
MTFEARLHELAAEMKSTKNEKKREALIEQMKDFVRNEFRDAVEPGQFFSVVGNFHRYNHIIAEAISNILDQQPVESFTNILSLLKGDIKNPLMYHLLARALVAGRNDVGQEWCDYLFNRITKYGTRNPSTVELQRIRAAFCGIPGLREKPLHALLQKEKPDRGVTLVLVALLGETGEKGSPSINDVILRQKILERAARIAGLLPGNEKMGFERLLKNLLHGKDVSYFVPEGMDIAGVGQDFLHSIGITGIRAGDDDTGIAVREINDSVIADKRKHIDKIGETGVPAKRYIEKLLDAERIIKDLSSLIESAKTSMQSLYRENIKLEEKTAEQSIMLGQLEAEKSALTENVSEKNLDIEKLQSQLQTQQADYETRIQRIIRESREARQLEIEQFRNRVVRDIQPIIVDMFSLDNISDPSERNEVLLDLIKTMLRTFKSSHGLEFTYE